VRILGFDSSGDASSLCRFRAALCGSNNKKPRGPPVLPAAPCESRRVPRHEPTGRQQPETCRGRWLLGRLGCARVGDAANVGVKTQRRFALRGSVCLTCSASEIFWSCDSRRKRPAALLMASLVRLAGRKACNVVERGQTAHQVERLVSGHRAGDLPSAPKTAGAERHVLRFEVSGEVLATFREALTKLRRDADGSLDDDAALLLMARQVLGGPVDEGRASYQVAITVCEACQRATQTGGGEAVEVSADVAAMASCDAQILPRAHMGNVDRAHVGRAEHAHVGRAEHAHVRETKLSHKATQTIPPAVRRSVLRRDQHRCQVPGCRHATFVDVHHIRPREEGGGHEPENLLTLCSAHHRACHRGALSIEGRAPAALRFRHADGTDYGAAQPPNRADVQLRAFRALRSLGFGERDARLALRQSATHMGENADLEPLLRHAIELLTARAWAKAS
jgi:hypothetical protein